MWRVPAALPIMINANSPFLEGLCHCLYVKYPVRVKRFKGNHKSTAVATVWVWAVFSKVAAAVEAK